jgi:hypothetical protein
MNAIDYKKFPSIVVLTTMVSHDGPCSLSFHDLSRSPISLVRQEAWLNSLSDLGGLDKLFVFVALCYCRMPRPDVACVVT